MGYSKVRVIELKMYRLEMFRLKMFKHKMLKQKMFNQKIVFFGPKIAFSIGLLLTEDHRGSQSTTKHHREHILEIKWQKWKRKWLQSGLKHMTQSLQCIRMPPGHSIWSDIESWAMMMWSLKISEATVWVCQCLKYLHSVIQWMDQR